MKIYMASALTHVPREFFSEYSAFLHELARTLRSKYLSHEVKYALVDSDPQLEKKPSEDRARLCYLWDRNMVEEADLLIAEASFPSTGQGIELQIAENKGIPIIVCFRDFGINRAAHVSYKNPDRSVHDLQIGEGFVSLMALGLPGVQRTIKYESTNDGITKLVAAVKLFERA